MVTRVKQAMLGRIPAQSLKSKENKMDSERRISTTNSVPVYELTSGEVSGEISPGFLMNNEFAILNYCKKLVAVTFVHSDALIVLNVVV